MLELINDLEATKKNLEIYIEDIRQDIEAENTKIEEFTMDSDKLLGINLVNKLENAVERLKATTDILDNILSKMTDRAENPPVILESELHKPVSKLREYIRNKKG